MNFYLYRPDSDKDLQLERILNLRVWRSFSEVWQALYLLGLRVSGYALLYVLSGVQQSKAMVITVWRVE